MAFQQLLSGLAEEHRKLEQERNELSEELSRLRRESRSSPGSRPLPLQALPGQVPPPPQGAEEAGLVAVRAVSGRQLRREAPEAEASAAHFVSVSLDGGPSATSSTQPGPEAAWRCFAAGLPAQAHHRTLMLEVLAHQGEGVPPVSVGSTSVEFRCLSPGRWEKRTEALPSKGGLVEFEVSWQPSEGGGGGGAETHSMGGIHKAPDSRRNSTTKTHLGVQSTSMGNYLLDEGEMMNRARQKARFRDIFGLNVSQQYAYTVTADNLGQVLAKRGLRNFKSSFLEQSLHELARVSPFKSTNPDGSGSQACSRDGQIPVDSFEQPRPGTGISFQAFVDVILMPDLPSLVEPKLSRPIEKIQKVLLRQDVAEVIARLSRKRIMMTVDLDSEDNVAPARDAAWTMRMDLALNVAVALTVVASVFCLAISTETDPDWGGWIVLEVLFAVIFISDSVLRMLLHGSHEFWFGHDRRWNWFDFAITSVSVGDVCLTLAIQAGSAGFGKFALVLRFFRLMRLARLLKIVRSPLIRELANMLMGFVLGSPALFWVSIIIWVTVALLAMGLRISVGPVPGDELLVERCGSGDNPLSTDPDCVVYKLYAEEYCGNLPKCMFTVFRCMIGDCTSSGGQSLASHFSAGFGARFDVVYLTGMIVMIFGLFNVITAIFVEATMSGLKYNESKQKLRSMYEHRYVKRKLEELVQRIQVVYHIVQKGKSGDNNEDGERLFQTKSLSSCWGEALSEDPDSTANIHLTEDDFFAVIGDSSVRRILMQLDIEVEGAGKEALFEIMTSSSDTGTVDVASMIDALMRLRGGTQKVDMVGPSVALRGLHQEVRRLALGLHGPAAAGPAVAALGPGASPAASPRADRSGPL